MNSNQAHNPHFAQKCYLLESLQFDLNFEAKNLDKK